MTENSFNKLDRKRTIIHGLAWNTLYQIFQTIISFGAMLVLVRIIPPAEYGRVTALLGFLAVLNSFSCHLFMSHALQLSDDVKPEWPLHFTAGFYIQGAISILCHGVAGFCWYVEKYQPVAPLLHLAAVGLLLNWPAHLRGTMLRREMDFKRLRVILAIGALINVSVTVAVGYAGGGAYAIILGSNVLASLPFTVDLFIVQGWRPNRDWWRWPGWSSYRQALHFGLQQSGSSLLHAVRGSLESVVLPVAFGYASMGYFSRAQGIYTTTIGQIGNVVTESVYPLLPRYSNSQNYPRYALLFVQVVFMIILPGAIYLGLEGVSLSRLLYGLKWVAADPLLWPGAILGFGLAAFSCGWTILLAANKLRTCFILNIISVCITIPIVAVAWHSHNVVTYAWSLAAAQILVSTISITVASRFLPEGWLKLLMLPPILCSAFGSMVILIYQFYLGTIPLFVRVTGSAILYAFTVILVLRIFFSATLSDMLSKLPHGDKLLVAVRLRPYAESQS